MKLVTKIFLAAAMLFASAGLLYDARSGSVDAAGVDYSRDCDKYAVMYCGAMTKSEMLKKYNNGDGQNSAANIQNIFSQFNLNATKIQNANFKDGIVYQNGEVKVDGKVVATNAQTYIRHLGGKGSASRMGSAQAAKIAINSDGKFLFAVMTPCGNPVTGKPIEPPKPKPQSISCDALKVTITNKKNRTVEAKVTGSAKNTKITGYKIDFGDGTKVNKQTASHTYKDYGKYTIIAHVSGKVNGSTKTVTSATCKKVVEFKKPPKPLEQSITCDALNLDLFNVDKKYVKVTVTGSAQNTNIDDYKIDFGDGTVVNEQTAEHTYSDFKEYTIKAYVSGKIKEEVVVVGGEGNCIQTVEFKEDIKPCPTDPTLPIDDPKCKPCPTNPDLNYDDPNCKEPEVPELPNTGAGALVGLFSGVSLLGAISHRVWLSRKLGM